MLCRYAPCPACLTTLAIPSLVRPCLACPSRRRRALPSNDLRCRSPTCQAVPAMPCHELPLLTSRCLNVARPACLTLPCLPCRATPLSPGQAMPVRDALCLPGLALPSHALPMLRELDHATRRVALPAVPCPSLPRTERPEPALPAVPSLAHHTLRFEPCRPRVAMRRITPRHRALAAAPAMPFRIPDAPHQSLR